MCSYICDTQIDGLVQEKHNSSVLAIYLHFSALTHQYDTCNLHVYPLTWLLKQTQKTWICLFPFDDFPSHWNITGIWNTVLWKAMVYYSMLSVMAGDDFERFNIMYEYIMEIGAIWIHSISQHLCMQFFLLWLSTNQFHS